jgi:hypothetical protein
MCGLNWIGIVEKAKEQRFINVLDENSYESKQVVKIYNLPINTELSR